MLDSTTFIIRECGERSADAAYNLLSQMAPAAAIFRVNTFPFSRSLAESLKRGLHQGREWTLCIDADVLVVHPGILELQAAAEMLPDHVFEVQGMVQDRFFGFRRPAGNHLYRTRYLKQALDAIPEEGSSLRPEHSTICRMRELGLVDVQLPLLAGLHDFEQHYHDIYRKCFLQGRKHDHLKDYLLSRWQREADGGDTEALIAHAAMSAGLEFSGDMMVDRRFQTTEINTALIELGVGVRPALEIDIITEEWVETKIQQESAESDTAKIVEQARVNVYYFTRTKKQIAPVPPVGLSPNAISFKTIIKAIATLPGRALKRLFS